MRHLQHPKRAKHYIDRNNIIIRVGEDMVYRNEEGKLTCGIVVGFLHNAVRLIDRYTDERVAIEGEQLGVSGFIVFFPNEYICSCRTAGLKNPPKERDFQ